MPLTTRVSASAGSMPSGTGDEVASVEERVGRPGAGLRDRRDGAAHERGSTPAPTAGDDADEVVAQDEREPRLAGVAVAAHALLGEGDAGGLHLDERLAGARDRDRTLPDDQAVGLDDAGKDDLGEGGPGGGHRNEPSMR